MSLTEKVINTTWREYSMNRTKKNLWKGDSQLGFLHHWVFTLKASSWFRLKQKANLCQTIRRISRDYVPNYLLIPASRGQDMLFNKKFCALVCHVATSSKCWKIDQPEVDTTIVLRFGFNYSRESQKRLKRSTKERTCFSQRLITDWQFLASFPQRGHPAEILSSRS